MTVTAFDPERDLIVVESEVWSRTRHRNLALAIDTASAATVIAPYAIEAVGYSRHDRIAVTKVRSAVGEETGYLLRVARFAALGFVVSDFEVNVFDLVAAYDIDGLVGLNFLRYFDYEIQSVIGRIISRPAMAQARHG